MFASYPNYEYLLTQIQLMLFMVAMGATLKLTDFAPVFQQPRDLLYGLTAQLLVMPMVALGFTMLFRFADGIELGLLLVAALPGGTLSNVFTYLARANVALSIALSACATLVAIVTMPLILGLLTQSTMPENFQMPVKEMIRDILLCLILPLVVGMVIRRLVPRQASTVSRIGFYLGVCLIIVMIIGSFGSGRVEIERRHMLIMLAIIVFCVLTQQLVMLPYRLTGGDPRVFVALGNEVTVRNVYLGLLLTILMFPADAGVSSVGKDVFFVTLFYGGVMLFAGLPLSLRFRRVIGRQAKQT